MIFRLLTLYVVLIFNSGLLLLLGINEIGYSTIQTLILFFAFTIQCFKSKLIFPTGLKWVIFYAIWLIISTIYHDGNLTSFSQIRFLISGYMVFFIMVNYRFNTKELKSFFNIIKFLFVLQIIVSIIKLITIGQIESIVGTMTRNAGGLATTFSLFVFIVCFVYYLYYKKIKHLIFSLIIFIVGIASGKLAIYYFIPFFSIIAIYFYRKNNHKNILHNYKNLLLPVYFLLFLIILGIFIQNSSKRARSFDDNVFENIISFLDYSSDKEFLLQSDKKETTTSRTLTSLRVIEYTFDSNSNFFLFGKGFAHRQLISGQITEFNDKELDIAYGITGWSWDALFFGWPAFFFHFLFYFSLNRKVIKLKKGFLNFKILNYLVTTSSCLFYLFFINYIFYNNNYTVPSIIVTLHAIVYGCLFSPKINKLLVEIYAPKTKKIINHGKNFN